jgi:hypothetical protein
VDRITSINLSSGDSNVLAGLATGNSTGFGNAPQVPEPSALLLALRFLV